MKTLKSLILLVPCLFFIGCATQKKATVYSNSTMTVSIPEDTVVIVVDKDFVRMMRINSEEIDKDNPYCQRKQSKEKIYFVECKGQNTLENFPEKEVKVITVED